MASFDVFDTLLARVTGDSKSSYYCLGKRLYARGMVNVDPAQFAELRSLSEHRAFSNAGGKDSFVTLDDIYGELCFSLGLDQAISSLLVEAEIEFEIEVLMKLPDGGRLLDGFRADGYQVAFVSDMYLGREVIKRALVKHGLFHDGDKVYVSSDYGKSKESGLLFREMISDFGVHPKSVIHVGNRYRPDYRSPKKTGARAIHFSQGNYNRYEKVLDSYNYGSGGLTGILAGVSRVCRNSCELEDDRSKSIWSISSSVVGPVLIGFVLWVFREAIKRNIKRLYFVSRDGQILYQIATRLSAALGLGFDIRYLYGSRQAWLLPSLEGAQLDLYLNEAFQKGKDVEGQTIRGLLDRVGIRPEDLFTCLERGGYVQGIWDNAMSRHEHDRFCEFCSNDVEVLDLVRQQSELTKNMVLKYFEQEGFGEVDRYGFVDLGQSGTLHRSLTRIVSATGWANPTSFYLASRFEGEDKSELLPCIYDRGRNLGWFDVPFLVTGMEAFCSGDHGTVVGYTISDDARKVEPVLKSPDNAPVREWGYEVVRSALMRFVDLLPTDSLDLNGDMRSAIPPLFSLLFKSPTALEAKSWGGFPMEDGWGGYSFYRPIAAPKYLVEILRARKVKRHTWVPGSIMMLPFPINYIAMVAYRVGFSIKRR